MKVRKDLTLDSDVAQHIEEQRNKYGFNFSDWVNSEYKKQFLSIDSKLAEIEEHKKQIARLDVEIAAIKSQAPKVDFTAKEMEFIKNVPILLKQGAELKFVCKRFNNEFGKAFDVSTFMKAVKAYTSF